MLLLHRRRAESLQTLYGRAEFRVGRLKGSSVRLQAKGMHNL